MGENLRKKQQKNHFTYIPKTFTTVRGIRTQYFG